MSQRKSAAVVLGVTALLAPSLTACSIGGDEVDDRRDAGAERLRAGLPP